MQFNITNGGFNTWFTPYWVNKRENILVVVVGGSFRSLQILKF